MEEIYAAAGVSETQLARVYAPVGLDIGSETPAEIALSILAEIMLAMRGGTGRPLQEARNPLFQKTGGGNKGA